MKKNKMTNEVRWWIIISEVDVIWGRVYSIVDKLRDIFIKGDFVKKDRYKYVIILLKVLFI